MTVGSGDWLALFLLHRSCLSRFRIDGFFLNASNATTKTALLETVTHAGTDMNTS
jgi:hypothetical protein